MAKLIAVLALFALLALMGAIEGALHRRNLRRIPIRIHVNGTRGKSSVTRLIAGGLRAGGIRTCAKTTGTEASMILPDGSEYAVYRPASPNIIEQVRIVATAASLDAHVLVIECMALQPLLQALSESRLIHATHAVITNSWADHLDVMGPEESDVARALAGTVPVRGQLYTSESQHLDVFEEAARDRSTDLFALSEDEVERIGDEQMSGFRHLEHKQNVALALRVCEALGVDRDVALRGMWNAQPDPGALTVHEIEFFGRRLLFANGFAANDPESTGRVWRRVIDLVPDVERRIAIFNCRVDRSDRSRQLGEACVGWPPADCYVLMGTGTYMLAREATRRGLDVSKLLIVEGQRPDDIFEAVLERTGRSALIMGMGNVHGGGEELARLFRNRGIQRELR
ncbi:MAG: poly-gamma-glutamate synthase PgsB [Deltaproteobacteria bacterium]|nr:MAG: poly-gamma-glutamate synthase PgsB [Deltaproteobacteria bacterium]